MSARRVSTTGRRLAAVPWAIGGAAMLLLPRKTTRWVCAGGPEPDLRVVRVLGARLVVQSAVTLVRPTREVVLAGAGLDLLHAASMGAARLAFPRLVRPIGVSAASSVAAALAGLAAAGR